MKVNFSTQHLRDVFADEEKYDSFKRLTEDLNHGNEIFEYDDNGVAHKISTKEANNAVRKILCEVCELSDDDLKSNKRRHRMLKLHEYEVFELLESDIDYKIETGFKESEWFNDFCEYRNLSLGDDEEFIINDGQSRYFIVANYSGNNHDLTMQHVSPGKTVKLHTNKYAVKIGKDIDLILLGRIGYSELTDKIAKSFVYHIQNLCHTEIKDAITKLPSQYKGTGPLNAQTKAQFDALIEDVQLANGSDVVIMGTKVALKNINNLSDVNWRPQYLKENVAHTGIIGDYEGTQLVVIDQRFALNDTSRKLIDNDMILIFPVSQDKFVKVVDRGETEITEITEKGELMDNFASYEVSRELGVATVFSNNFGYWDI